MAPASLTWTTPLHQTNFRATCCTDYSCSCSSSALAPSARFFLLNPLEVSPTSSPAFNFEKDFEKDEQASHKNRLTLSCDPMTVWNHRIRQLHMSDHKKRVHQQNMEKGKSATSGSFCDHICAVCTSHDYLSLSMSPQSFCNCAEFTCVV